MKTQINKEWHETHRMPKNSTVDRRIEWHLDHVKNCSCRKIPGKFAEEMRKRGVKF
jgi:hypothetical protein